MEQAGEVSWMEIDPNAPAPELLEMPDALREKPEAETEVPVETPREEPAETPAVEETPLSTAERRPGLLGGAGGFPAPLAAGCVLPMEKAALKRDGTAHSAPKGA